VDLLVKEVERRCGAPPLLVLPAHYLRGEVVPNHTQMRFSKPSKPYKGAHQRTEAQAAIVHRWRASEHVWAVGEGADDDIYWMMATLVRSEAARGAAGGPRAEEPSIRVVTNDGMKDHARAAERAFDRRVFRRWAAHHVAHFSFSQPCTAERTHVQVILNDPPSFLVCCHANDASGPRRAWHLPRGPDGDAWLCVSGSPPVARVSGMSGQTAAASAEVMRRKLAAARRAARESGAAVGGVGARVGAGE